jgi:hypothetical protein
MLKACLRLLERFARLRFQALQGQQARSKYSTEKTFWRTGKQKGVSVVLQWSAWNFSWACLGMPFPRKPCGDNRFNEIDRDFLFLPRSAKAVFGINFAGIRNVN